LSGSGKLWRGVIRWRRCNNLTVELHKVEEDLTRETNALQSGWWFLCGEQASFVLYLIAWLNAFVVALYVTTIPIELYDNLLRVFPFINGAHVVLEMVLCKGPARYFRSTDREEKKMVRMLNVLVVCISFVGMFFQLIQAENGVLGVVVEVRIQRLLVGITVILVFSRSRQFLRMINMMNKSISSCWPFIATMIIVMLAFGQLCETLFKDSDIPPYFSDPWKSFTTTIQLFVGEGWNSIMWDVGQATNYASTLLFIAYVFFSTLLFGQLVLGVIIAVFCEAESFPSVRIYEAIAPIYHALNETERETLIEDFLKINYLLVDVHEQIEKLNDSIMDMGSRSEHEGVRNPDAAAWREHGAWDFGDPSSEEAVPASPGHARDRASILIQQTSLRQKRMETTLQKFAAVDGTFCLEICIGYSVNV